MTLPEVQDFAVVEQTSRARVVRLRAGMAEGEQAERDGDQLGVDETWRTRVD